MLRINETDSQAEHLEEWLDSGVDEEIFHLNARSLYGTTPYEYLLYSPKISRRNDGRLRDRDLKKYQHIELGGWWCSGVDPLNEYALMMWGCFKPDYPRRDRQKIHKFIKYEHPYREETRAFFLLVPNRIWVKVSNRSGIPITEFDLQHPGGFWHWVWKHNVPVTIVEGVKKAGALLTAGNDDYSYVDQNFQPESLQTWGKRGSVINVEMRCYQESVLAGLVEDGYTVIDADDADDDESGAVIESVKAASVELYTAECKAIADSPTISDAELKKLQDKRAKTKTERHQQRKAELSRRYEIDVTPDLVEKDDDGWYPQLRMHYYLTLGREFLTTRDAKRAKAQLEAGENSIWKPDFNKGQMLSSVLLLEELNLLQLLTPGERLRSSDEAMQEFKALALKHRHVIKNYLNVSISEKLTPIAIAQKLLAKIDLKLNYVGRLGKRENRECVYQFVAPDDQRDSIFGQWLNRDEVFLSELVSVNNNIVLPTPMIDTTSQLIPKNTDLVSVTNNIEFPTQVTDTTSHGIPLSLNQVESPVNQGWKGLKLKLQQGLDNAGKFYTELVSTIGEAVGVADGEPYWNGYLGQWQVWVNFASGCTSVVCNWLEAV